MRILFVNQYYWPDYASTGQHLTDLAQHLAAHGHEVRVVCSRGRYGAGGSPAALREVHKGVEILRVPSTSLGRTSLLGRVVDYACFHAFAGLRTVLSNWPDVVVTLTTPPVIGWCGALARRMRGIVHIHYVMDLHPDAEFELGMLRRDSLIGRLLEWCNAAPMRAAHANVVLGPCQAARVKNKGVRPDRIEEIPVWSDGHELAPIAKMDNPLAERLGWQDRFVVMYSGNAGLVHRFDELLEAARILNRQDPEVLFSFVGGGPRKAEIEEKVREFGLGNVEFHDYFPREELRYSLQAADCHFMSLRPEHSGVAVPGKLYGILASGRPALFVGSPRSESAQTIERSQAGLVIAASGLGRGTGAAVESSGRKLADAIRHLKCEPKLRAEMGRRGREHFLSYHERDVCVGQWRNLIEAIASEASLDSTFTQPVHTGAEPGHDLEAIPSLLPKGRSVERSQGSARVASKRVA